MSQSQEDTNDQPGAQVDDSKPEAAGEGSPEAQTTDEAEAQDAGKTSSVDELPEWAQQEIRNLRREAGNYRTQYNAVKDAAVKTEGEFNALKQQLEVKERAFTRERIGADLGLPAELRSRLQGDTEDEIRADAQAVAALIKPAAPQQPPATPSGGLDTSSDPAPSPTAAAELIRSRRY